MPKPEPGKVDWIKLEVRIRQTLRRYLSKDIDPYEALAEVDDTLGEETDRGRELE